MIFQLYRFSLRILIEILFIISFLVAVVCSPVLLYDGRFHDWMITRLADLEYRLGMCPWDS